MELNVNDNYIVQSANYLNGIDAQRIPGASLANIDGTRMTSASQMLKHANRYSGPVVSFEAEKGVKLQSLIANVTAWQEGSGDPAPDNVRPIHGWDGITLSQAGFNLWDEEWELGTIGTDGTEGPSTTRIRSKNYSPCLPNTPYYGFNGSGASAAGIRFYDSDKNYVGYLTAAALNNNIFNTPGNAYYFKLSFADAYGIIYNGDICINFSDPARNGEYVPYDGRVYNISWSDSAGTVYGGTIDLVKGLLTVTHEAVDLGSIDYSYDAINSRFVSGQITGMRAMMMRTMPIICSAFLSISDGRPFIDVPDMAIYNGSTDQIYIHDSDYTDSALFKAAVSGYIAVYERAEPAYYQLAPTAIYTLDGLNNIFADTGTIADAVVPFYPLEHIWQILY